MRRSGQRYLTSRQSCSRLNLAESVAHLVCFNHRVAHLPVRALPQFSTLPSPRRFRSSVSNLKHLRQPDLRRSALGRIALIYNPSGCVSVGSPLTIQRIYSSFQSGRNTPRVLAMVRIVLRVNLHYLHHRVASQRCLSDSPRSAALVLVRAVQRVVALSRLQYRLSSAIAIIIAIIHPQQKIHKRWT